MPAGYSQQSAASRADRQARAGYTYVGVSGDGYEASDGILRRVGALGPPLPDTSPSNTQWKTQVRQWYMAFRLSPMAELLNTDIDWQNMILAMVHLNDYYDTGNMQAYRAFERMTAQFGATPGSRRRIRVGIGSGDATTALPTAVDAQSAMDEFDQQFADLTAELLE